MKGLGAEEKLELAISYILIIGVAASVAVESIGIVDYYFMNRSMEITFQPEFALKGANIFTYTRTVLSTLLSGELTRYNILGLGVAIMVMTPYVRVWASVIYFSIVKNPKYFFITGIVLVILTVSMLLH